jgi:hypothetical protein
MKAELEEGRIEALRSLESQLEVEDHKAEETANSKVGSRTNKAIPSS